MVRSYLRNKKNFLDALVEEFCNSEILSHPESLIRLASLIISNSLFTPHPLIVLFNSPFLRQLFWTWGKYFYWAIKGLAKSCLLCNFLSQLNSLDASSLAHFSKCTISLYKHPSVQQVTTNHLPSTASRHPPAANWLFVHPPIRPSVIHPVIQTHKWLVYAY